MKCWKYKSLDTKNQLNSLTSLLKERSEEIDFKEKRLLEVEKQIKEIDMGSKGIQDQAALAC